jgi:pyrimidine operon attenuation protein / uracil phosphoribosyltransferase
LESQKIIRELLDSKGIERSLNRISHQILENNQGCANLAIVGIRTRGATIASRLVKKIEMIEGVKPLFGILDITLYRDDLTCIAQQPIVKKTEISFDVTDKTIVLVDDVLYTGRTIRSALDAIIDFGRPRCIQLAVLVDRGHRELPINANFVGIKLETADSENVAVRLYEDDNDERVVLQTRG